MLEEVRKTWRDEVVDSFESVQKDFELKSLCDREPAKFNTGVIWWDEGVSVMIRAAES